MTGSSECLDLYALAVDRSLEVVERFRDQGLVGFEESADGYPFPQFAEQPDVIYHCPESWSTGWLPSGRRCALPQTPRAAHASRRSKALVTTAPA
jgi:hypothetical protein